MRRETLDRPNLASRKISVERSLRRAIPDLLVVRTDAFTVVNVKRCVTTSSCCVPLHRRALYPGNQNEINEPFVARLPSRCADQTFVIGATRSIGTV